MIEDVKEARWESDPKLEKMRLTVLLLDCGDSPKASEEARYAFSREDAP